MRAPPVRKAREPGTGTPGSEAHQLAKAFGATFRIARLRCGISQEAIALAGNFDRTYISLIERGEREPRLSFFIRLCDAVGVPPARMLERVLARRTPRPPAAPGHLPQTAAPQVPAGHAPEGPAAPQHAVPPLSLNAPAASPPAASPPAAGPPAAGPAPQVPESEWAPGERW